MENSSSPAAAVPPVLRITHVTRAANDEIIQFGYVDLVDDVAWHVPRSQLISMIRSGMVFITGYGGQCAEVVVASRPPGNDPVIFTTLDTLGFKLLSKLPDLP